MLLRNSVRRIGTTRSMCGIQQHFFSTDAPAKSYRYPTQKEAFDAAQVTVLPFLSSETASPSDCSPHRPVDTGNGMFSSIPESFTENCDIRVYRRSKNALQNSIDMCKPWRLDVDNSERWTNQLMNYASAGNPLQVTGIRKLRFDTLEAATRYLEEHGLSYYIEKPYERPDVTGGEKSYAHNFLNYHVRNRRSKWSKKKFAATQFAHPERGTDCWVNLKHSNHGAKASEKVSMTQWTDPHPNNLSAKHWYMDNLAKKQELARKLGK